MSDYSRFDRCRWFGCDAPCVDEFELCWHHYRLAGETFVEHRSIWGSRWLRANADAKRERDAAGQARHFTHIARRHQMMQDQTVVYYVRIGDRVKIGYSINLRQRLTALRVNADAVLATEPGGRELESRRHQEFAAERVGRREDFNPSRRLLAHIESTRNIHGDPNLTTYPKMSTAP